MTNYLIKHCLSFILIILFFTTNITSITSNIVCSSDIDDISFNSVINNYNNVLNKINNINMDILVHREKNPRTKLNTKKIEDGDAFDGYTIYTPMGDTKTYLIDNEGGVFHTWNSRYLPGKSVYLLENGNLLRTASVGNLAFLAGGAGGLVQEFNSSENVIWEFKYSTNWYCQHHDIEILPNGNILMLAWEFITRSQALEAGRDPYNLSNGLWVDHIIEVEPTGTNGGNIVWEWHVWDHLIQDSYPDKENYGVISDHPELIDINVVDNNLHHVIHKDLVHSNSIDYNEEFDQILISASVYGEIWVIDHSTNTEEAAGHKGGKSGRGGDLLYRWGNPQRYDAGDENNRMLFFQHDAQWIEPGNPGEGNILVFNNGFRRPDGNYSTVEEIVPPVDSNGNYYLETNSVYGPTEPIWIYKANNPFEFYSINIGGAQRLPNGNTLICDGANSFFFEVTNNKEIVWEYLNQFPFNDPNIDVVFTIRKYPEDYPGLDDLISFAPDKPIRPSGPMIGRTGVYYSYKSSTTDPDDDKIYYIFDWGDEDSDLIGPYNSGDTVTSSHKWSGKESYTIRVKAKDVNGLESEWSDPLTVSMPKNKFIYRFQLFCRFLKQHPLLPPYTNINTWLVDQLITNFFLLL